jgi:CDP-diacylglycerol--glycerol-3-phosphate 3-phosphatidyltransferase
MPERLQDAAEVKRSGREMVRRWLRPVVEVIAGTGVHPNWLSVGGLLLTAVAAAFFARGEFTIASLWALAGALLDAMDGEVARAQGRQSTFGAFLDSTLDRVSDTLLFLGVAGYYFYRPVWAAASLPPTFEARLAGYGTVDDYFRGMAAVLALAGAYLVSYTRSRAEGLGTPCQVGWFERPERLIVLIGAALFGVGVLMDIALVLLVVMSWFTAGQRFLYVRRRLASAPPPGKSRDRKSAR